MACSVTVVICCMINVQNKNLIQYTGCRIKISLNFSMSFSLSKDLSALKIEITDVGG